MDFPSGWDRKIRAVVAVALVAALTGCATAAEVDAEDAPASRPTNSTTTTPIPEGPEAPDCITVSTTWLGHIQYFMEDGYTATRAAAAPAGDGYTSIALLYTSPSGEEILGSWGTGGDPSSEVVMQVFPLDDVTGSHTVVMTPNSSILAKAGQGTPAAITCLG